MADPKLPGIYAIRNTVSGRVYVGSSINIARRWQVHRSNLKTGVHRCKPLQRAYDKHGAAAFLYEVLELVPELTNLVTREQHWLDTLDCHCERNGYNVCPMAESRLGMRMSAEARAKIGKAHKGRKATAEAKANIALAWRTRAPASAETRAKIGAAHRGRKHSAEHTAKIAAANRGKTISDAQKAMVSMVHKGKTISQAQRDAVRNAHLGKPRSAETIAKMRAAMTGRVYSDEHRRNISLAKQGRPWSQEMRKAVMAGRRLAAIGTSSTR